MFMRKDFSKKALLAGLCAAALITILAYYPGMSAGFYFDDEPNILWVDAVQWTQLTIETVQRTLSDVLITSRPVANISIGLNHLVSGLEPAPYHWTNLVIHLAAGLALYWVLRLFQQYHGKSNDGEWLTLLVVFLFLVHPLNTQAVTYVIQRMTSSATLFFLLCLGSYLTGRHASIGSKQVAWFGIAFMFAMLSIGSKETGYLLIPILLLYEYCFHREKWWSRYTAVTTPRSHLILIVGTVIFFVIMVSLSWQLLDGRIYWSETMPRRDFSGLERVMTQGRVQFFYLSLLLWPAPSRLNLDHDFVISRGLLDPVSTSFALAGWALVLAFALWNARSRPRLAFPILAYLLLHSMESAPISLELVFEHRMYLPMTMLALLATLNLNPLSRKKELASYGTICVIGLLLSIGTFQRNQVWGDPLTFFRDCAQKSPNKWRAQYNLGTNLGKLGIVDEARMALQQAVAIRPDDSETHNQLANVFMMKEQNGGAEKHYRLAVEHNSGNAEALYNLSVLLSQQQRYSEQREVLEQFILHAPPYLERQKQWAINYLKRE